MQPERRYYKRSELDFHLEIKGTNRKGYSFGEVARLCNISGGGAQFVTSYRHNYFEGQILEISVVLPETREVKGHMDTTATVTRLVEKTSADQVPEQQKSRVSVRFERRFQLVRTEIPA